MKVHHHDLLAKVSTHTTAQIQTQISSDWQDFMRQYEEGYNQTTDSMSDKKVNEFDYEKLKKALKPLAKFQRSSNTRVIELGLLKGLYKLDVASSGWPHVREGCLDFFLRITMNKDVKVKAHCISNCLCAYFISSVFCAGGLFKMPIHANGLQYEGLISIGDIIRNVESPKDKLKCFLKTREETANLSVYIGDSVTDLLCLLQADIGIVFTSSTLLIQIAGRFGVSFMPFFPVLVKKQRDHTLGWSGLSGVLYTVSSWAEIDHFSIGSI